MSKHHIENLAEQIANKGHASAPFHYGKNSNNASKPIVSKESQTNVVDEESIQLRAYQIHQEKGGSDLDNWLEAEQNLKNDISRLINEGDPNTQTSKK